MPNCVTISSVQLLRGLSGQFLDKTSHHSDHSLLLDFQFFSPLLTVSCPIVQHYHLLAFIQDMGIGHCKYYTFMVVVSVSKLPAVPCRPLDLVLPPLKGFGHFQTSILHGSLYSQRNVVGRQNLKNMQGMIIIGLAKPKGKIICNNF